MTEISKAAFELLLESRYLAAWIEQGRGLDGAWAVGWLVTYSGCFLESSGIESVEVLGLVFLGGHCLVGEIKWDVY